MKKRYFQKSATKGQGQPSIFKEKISASLVSTRKKNLVDLDDLTPDQVRELDAAIEEAESGKTIPFEEFKKDMELWCINYKLMNGLT